MIQISAGQTQGAFLFFQGNPRLPPETLFTLVALRVTVRDENFNWLLLRCGCGCHFADYITDGLVCGAANRTPKAFTNSERCGCARQRATLGSSTLLVSNPERVPEHSRTLSEFNLSSSLVSPGRCPGLEF